MRQDKQLIKAEFFFNRVFPSRNIQRVLLVTPPDADETLFRYDTAKRKRYTNYPPYGLLVIAQVLESLGVKVEICNLNFEVLQECRKSKSEKDFNINNIWQTKLDEKLAKFLPDLVGVTCMFTMTHESFKGVVERTSSQGFPVAIGGVHVSNDIDSILKDIPSASIAFLREGEVAIKYLVEAVNQTGLIDRLGQIILNDDGKKIEFKTDCMPTEKEINIFPAYHLINVGEYSDHGTIGAFYCFKPEDTKFATVLSNRGCRARCTFCSVRNFNGIGVRQRSISSVIEEIKFLENEHGVSHIMWLDDDLLKDHGRAIKLFDAMVKNNLSVTWDATNGVIASSCTEEVVSAAAASGCIAINIGMESGNREVLKSVRKPGTVETFLAAAQVLRKFEQIHSSVFLMIGFPGETMSMILDTIEVAREMDLDWYRCSQLQPLPNTPIFDSMVAQGLIKQSAGGDLRFNGGAYGKQTELEQGLRLATPNFIEAFSEISLESVPTPEQLTDIWFFMNYHLNFSRIFNEKRPEKIKQLKSHLSVLADVISPENGFSLYFLAYLDFKSNGRINPLYIERLTVRLQTSPYWRDRFSAFGLTLDQLKTYNFSSKKEANLIKSIKLESDNKAGTISPNAFDLAM